MDIHMSSPLEPLSHFPLYPTPLGCHRATDLSSLLASYSKFLLLSNFTHGNIHISMLVSQLIPPSPSPAGSTNLFSTPMSPSLPCR